MQLSTDENFPYHAAEALRQQGHDVLWVHDAMPGASDDAVIARAGAEQRLLLTQDKDFGQLVFVLGWRHAVLGVVLFRLASPSPAVLARRIVAALENGPDFTGQFAVVEETRIRLRALATGP